jgi:hypothetical protein
MLALNLLPEDYESWNRRWYVPNGRQMSGRLRGLLTSPVFATRPAVVRFHGPFAWQDNTQRGASSSRGRTIALVA